MKYASTTFKNNRETVKVVLPFDEVPAFDPEHPHPFTYSVPDEVEKDWVKQWIVPPEYDPETRELITPGEYEFTPPPPPTTEELIDKYTATIQRRLDAFAQTRNYDNIFTACTYVTSEVPSFRTEAEHCVHIRDTTWSTCYQIMGEVLAGERTIPTLDELLELLPRLVWPDEAEGAAE